MHSASELALLIDLKEGSLQAYKIIYKKYWRLLLSEAMRRLGDLEQSEDAVQEVFILLWEKRTVLVIQNLGAYLKTCLRNHIYHLSLKKKSSTHFFALMEEVTNTFSETSDTPLITAELFAAYRNLVSGMPTQRRKIFEMKIDEDLSTREIAEKLQITRKTVQNQMLRSTNELHMFLNSLLGIALFFFQEVICRILE